MKKIQLAIMLCITSYIAFGYEGGIFRVSSPNCHPAGTGATKNYDCWWSFVGSDGFVTNVDNQYTATDTTSDGSCTIQSCVVDIQNGTYQYCGNPKTATCNYTLNTFKCGDGTGTLLNDPQPKKGTDCVSVMYY